VCRITSVSRGLPRAQQDAKFIGLAPIRREGRAAFTELVRVLDAQRANARSHLPTLFEEVNLR